jgi:hypothetical protein
MRISEQKKLSWNRDGEPMGFVVVDIQNVMDWLYNMEPSDLKKSSFAELRNLVSPWPRAVYEWSTVKWGGHLEAAMVYLQEKSDTPGVGWTFEATLLLREGGQIFDDFRYKGDIFPDGMMPPFEWATGDDHDELEVATDMRTGELRDPKSPEVAAAWFRPVAFALSFANCHNVRVRDNVTLPTRQMRRHGGQPLVYKTLDIPGFSEGENSEGVSRGGTSRRFHVCRGHFAHHENLFGRLGPRTVWVPAHVRGDRDTGTVLKDYKVKT